MVIAGIGGKTIEEAKRAMSTTEFASWVAYRNKYGPFDVRRHLEHGFAMVTYMVAQGIPQKAGARRPKFEDFLPSRPKELTIDDLKRMGAKVMR